MFQQKTLNSRLTSVSRWSVRADWQGGISWADFVSWANPGEYKYVYTESYGGYNTACGQRIWIIPPVYSYALMSQVKR